MSYEDSSNSDIQYVHSSAAFYMALMRLILLFLNVPGYFKTVLSPNPTLHGVRYLKQSGVIELMTSKTVMTFGLT